MRVLQIGADRSKRGILDPDSAASQRQKAYGEKFGSLDIVGFSVRSDGRVPFEMPPDTHVYPTNSISKIFYGLDTIRIMRKLPKPDVISAQDPFETGLLSLLIARMLGVPLHVQVHTDFLAPGYVQLSLVNRLRTLVAGFVLRRAVRIRVVSERVKAEILERYHLQASVTVLPIFVDLEKFHNAQADPVLNERFARFKTKVLVVSRLEPEKNVALAIESFTQAAPQDACLIIVGTGSEEGKLRDLVREKDIADQVFFEGERPGVDYYPLADLVLVTSRYEGYGLVIVEALARGLPILSTDVGVAREMGVVVADEKEFPDALAKWFENGPKEMRLTDYPYKSFDDYVGKYCEDISASIRK
jgi:glycosyltransferase involved in cell wall biosynthesis